MDWEEVALTRRDALKQCFGGVALVCSFDLARPSRPGGRTSAARRVARAAQFEPFRVDVPITPVLQPTRRTRTTEYYALRMGPGEEEILPGVKTPVLGYRGQYPGPTIRVRRGVKAEVRQTNGAGRDLNVHLHGGVTPPDSDGHPMDAIPTGAERTYHYPNVQRGATLWYHDHSHGETARTLYQGLAGFYIVEDPDEEELELPREEYDVPLMIADRSFNADGSFRYRVDIDRGFRGDTILVNGAIQPRMRVERRLYRLRFLNASNARAYALSLGNGRQMIQIGGDAGLLHKPQWRRVIGLEPAERVDVLIDFRQFGAGSKVILHNVGGEPSTTAVMRFDVVRGGAEDARVPRRLRPRDPLPPVNAERTFGLTLTGLARPQWQIAGLGFGMERIDCRPRRGSTELWQFVNNSQRSHPMHLHGYHFRVVSQNGKPPHPGDAAWKDTVAVPANARVTVRPYFDHFDGRYVFHCHAAEHGDMSMMGQMEVVT